MEPAFQDRIDIGPRPQILGPRLGDSVKNVCPLIYHGFWERELHLPPATASTFLTGKLIGQYETIEGVVVLLLFLEIGDVFLLQSSSSLSEADLPREEALKAGCWVRPSCRRLG